LNAWGTVSSPDISTTTVITVAAITAASRLPILGPRCPLPSRRLLNT
jgi:alpha-D-ribose 1-methylphosphonate 5-triphosphate synthase subunit PhnH